MSAPPIPYTRQANFTNFATEQFPTTGQGLEGEFNKIAQSIRTTQSRLAEIQRDDGKLKNASVHIDALSEGVAAMLAFRGGEIRGDWQEETAYKRHDVVASPTGGSYIAVEDHTSTHVFTDDLAGGLWISVDMADRLLSDAGSTLISFKRQAAGSVLLTAQQKLETLPISPKEFGYQGARDETASIQATLDACPDGGVVSFAGLPGCTISAPLTVSGKSIEIDWAGVAVTATHSGRMFEFTGALGEAREVSSIDFATSTLTMDPSGLAIGDRLKLVSDDRLAGTRPIESDGRMSRMGQYVTVVEIGSGTVRVAQRMRYAFATNIRAVKVEPNTLISRRQNFGYADGISGSYTCMAVYNGQRHLIDTPRFRRLPFIGLSLHGCDRYTVRNPIIDKAPTSSPNGHGISDWSCYGGYVDAAGASDVRHLFTTNQNPVVDGSTEYYYYGPSYGFTVVCPKAGGSGSTTVDTHHGAEDGLIIGAVISDSYTNAVGIRGRRITHVAPIITNAESGFLVYSEVDVDEADWTEDITIISPQTRGIADYPFRAQRCRRVFVENAKLASTGYNAIYLIDASVAFSNTRIEAADPGGDTSGGGNNLIQLQGSCNIQLHGYTYITIPDLRNFTTANRIFTATGTGNTRIVAENMVVSAPSVANLTLIASGSSISLHHDVRVEIRGPTTVTRVSGGNVSAESTIVLRGTAGNSQYMSGSAGVSEIAFGNSGDPVITRGLSATSNTTVTGIAPGKFPGQYLILWSQSTNTITIPNGTLPNGVTMVNKGATDATLSASRQSVHYVWSNNQWIQVV